MAFKVGNPGCPCCSECTIVEDHLDGPTLSDTWTLADGSWDDTTIIDGYTETTGIVELWHETPHPDTPYAPDVRVRVRGAAGSALRLIASASGDVATGDALIVELTPGETCGTLTLYQRLDGVEDPLAETTVYGAVVDEWHDLRLCYDPETTVLTGHVLPHDQTAWRQVSIEVEAHTDGEYAGIASGTDDASDFDTFVFRKLWYDVIITPLCAKITITDIPGIVGVSPWDPYGSGVQFSLQFWNGLTLVGQCDLTLPATVSGDNLASYVNAWVLTTAPAELANVSCTGSGTSVGGITLTFLDPDSAYERVFISVQDLSPPNDYLQEAWSHDDAKIQVDVAGTLEQFALSYDSEQTDVLSTSASAVTIQSALEGLTTIGAGNVSVMGVPGEWQVTWGGTLIGTDILPLVAVENIGNCRDYDYYYYAETERITCSECAPQECQFVASHFDDADSICEWITDDVAHWSIDDTAGNEWLTTSTGQAWAYHSLQHPSIEQPNPDATEGFYWPSKLTADLWAEDGATVRLLLGYDPDTGKAVAIDFAPGATCGTVDFWQVDGGDTRTGNHHVIFGLTAETWWTATAYYMPNGHYDQDGAQTSLPQATIVLSDGTNSVTFSAPITSTGGRYVGFEQGGNGEIRVRTVSAYRLYGTIPAAAVDNCPLGDDGCAITERIGAYAGDSCDYDTSAGTWSVGSDGLLTGSGTLSVLSAAHEARYVASFEANKIFSGTTITLYGVTLTFTKLEPDPEELDNQWEVSVTGAATDTLTGTYETEGDGVAWLVVTVCRSATNTRLQITSFTNDSGYYLFATGYTPPESASMVVGVHDVSGVSISMWRHAIIGGYKCPSCYSCNVCADGHWPREALQVDLGIWGLTTASLITLYYNGDVLWIGAPLCDWCPNVGGSWLVINPNLTGCVWSGGQLNVCSVKSFSYGVPGTLPGHFLMGLTLQSGGPGGTVRWELVVGMWVGGVVEGGWPVRETGGFATYASDWFCTDECDTTPVILTLTDLYGYGYTYQMTGCQGVPPTTVTLRSA